MILYGIIIYIIVGIILCVVAYGVYRLFKELHKWQISENKRQKELQETLANISDKNLSVVMLYLHERLNQAGILFFVLVFLLLILAKK